MKHFLLIALIALYAYALFVELPYSEITPAEFDADHYAAWYNFPQARIDALAEATQPGTTIACFDKPMGDHTTALWNEDFSNKVLKLESIDEMIVELWMTDGLYSMRSTPIIIPDYIYLRADDNRPVGEDWIMFYADDWGKLFRRVPK